MEGPSRHTGMPLQKAAESKQTLPQPANQGPGLDVKSALAASGAHLPPSDQKRLEKWGAMHINPLDDTQTSPPLGKKMRVLEHIARQVSGDPLSESAPKRIQVAVGEVISSVEGGITSESGRLDLMHALVEEHSALMAIKVPFDGPSGLVLLPLFEVLARNAFQAMKLHESPKALAEVLASLPRDDRSAPIVEGLVRFITLSLQPLSDSIGSIDVLVDKLFRAPTGSPTPEWLTAALKGFIFRSESSWHRNVALLVEQLFRAPVTFTPAQIREITRALFVGTDCLPITDHFSTFGKFLRSKKQCKAIGRELAVAHHRNMHVFARLLVRLVEKGPEKQAKAVARAMVGHLTPASRGELATHIHEKHHRTLAAVLGLDSDAEILALT